MKTALYNHAFSQKLFDKNLKLPETLCAISRYAQDIAWKNRFGVLILSIWFCRLGLIDLVQYIYIFDFEHRVGSAK